MAAKNVEIVVLLSGFGSLKADRTVFLGGRRQLRETYRLFILTCFVVMMSPSHTSEMQTCCQTKPLCISVENCLRFASQILRFAQNDKAPDVRLISKDDFWLVLSEPKISQSCCVAPRRYSNAG
jgi:hypothetical protein